MYAMSADLYDAPPVQTAAALGGAAGNRCWSRHARPATWRPPSRPADREPDARPAGGHEFLPQQPDRRAAHPGLARLEQALRRDFSGCRPGCSAPTALATHRRRSRARTAEGRRVPRPWQLACRLRHPPRDLLAPVRSRSGDRARETIVPGEIRRREVSVGRHVAPAFESVGRFSVSGARSAVGVRRGGLRWWRCRGAPPAQLDPSLRGWQRPRDAMHTHTLLSALGCTGDLWSPLRNLRARWILLRLPGGCRRAAPRDLDRAATWRKPRS